MKIKKTCQALDSDGKRCRSRAPVKPVRYHGNPELYFYDSEREPKWVFVYLCANHREKP